MYQGVQILQKCCPYPHFEIWGFMEDLSPLFTKILDCPQPEDFPIFPIEVAISLSPKIGENWGIPIIPQLSPKAAYSKRSFYFQLF